MATFTKSKYFLNSRIVNSRTVNLFFKQKLLFSSLSEVNVVRSKLPDIAIPNILINDYIWSGLDRWNNKIALECAETGRQIRYSELHQKCNALSNFLHRFPNLKFKDTIAVILPNVPEFPIAVFGGIQAGFKVTTVNPILTSDEIAKQLVNSEAKLIITLDEYCPKVKQALKTKLPVISIKHQQSHLPEDTISFDEAVSGDSKLNFNVASKTEDVAFLPYSSGTTGVPKGVQITHRNFLATLYHVRIEEIRLALPADGTHQDVLPAILPMFHIYGMIIAFSLLSFGSKLITIPKFTPQIFHKVLTKEPPRFLYTVPPLILLLINSPHFQATLENLETILCGAAPLGASDFDRLSEKTNGKVALLQGYGLTETSGLNTHQTKHLPNGVKLGGSGVVVSNSAFKIVPLDGNSEIGLGPHQSGEILHYGPQNMKGYFNNPEASKTIFTSDGWLRTGDIGYYDEDDQLFVTDRLKELIKVKGFQVAPAELEELLRTHPDIEDAAVIGASDSLSGEVPKAFVVVKKGSNITSTAVQEFVAAKVAKYKQLKGGVVMVDSIPKNASGKILRRQLKEL